MFALAYQSGAFVEVFDVRTSSEKDRAFMNLFKIEQAAQSQKISDKSLKSQVLEIQGSGNRIKLPKNDKQGLGLTQRFLVVQILIQNSAAWTMELIVADQTKNKRISFNSGIKEIENKQCNLLVPTSSLIPANKWLNLQIDCASFLESSSSSASSGNKFKSLEAIIISAPCRIRRIFTSKSLIGSKKPQGDHAEEIPKIFSFPGDVESENILISFSSVSEIFKEKHSQMADTFNSKFGDSLGQLESPMNSTQGMSIAFQKSQSNQSEPDKIKIKKAPCDPIQELPGNYQHRGSNRNPRDLSSSNTTSEKISKQGIPKNINKYPLPHPSSSQSSSSHAKYQYGGYLGRNTISQEDDCKEFQTTAVSDLRGSVNTMNSGKQRIAMSPPDVSSSYSSNQLQNASSNTFNSTAASKGQRVNSRLGKHTPLSTQKSNNYTRLNEQSKSPKTTNSGTTTTTTSAAKSNPWSTNISKANKANYISAGGVSESSDSIPGVKSYTNLTPERAKQYRVSQEIQRVPNGKAREVNKQPITKQKQLQQKPEKTNTSSIKKPGVSQEAHTPPPRKHDKTEGNKRQLSVSRNQMTENEYFEMSQKFSTLGDPRLFQIEHIIEDKNTSKSQDNQKIQVLKSKAQVSQQVNKKPAAAAVGMTKITKNYPQNDRNGVANKITSNSNKLPQNQKDDNFKEEEQIEEVIETESKLADGHDDWEQCKKDEDFDPKNHNTGTQNKTLKNVGSGYFHSGESQESYNDDKRLTMNNEGLMPNGINQNSTGLSFTKPNLIVKRKESGATDFQRTGQHHYQHMRSSREESEENDRIKNKTDGFVSNQQYARNYKSDVKQKDQVFKQQLPDIDEQTIPDTDTLKQTQTNFFKEQMNIFAADMRPFTPPFNQVGKVVSASNQSTISMSKKGKEMEQSDHQIEVIYDDVLNCYYDPKTNQYFDLKS